MFCLMFAGILGWEMKVVQLVLHQSEKFFTENKIGNYRFYRYNAIMGFRYLFTKRIFLLLSHSNCTLQYPLSHLSWLTQSSSHFQDKLLQLNPKKMWRKKNSTLIIYMAFRTTSWSGMDSLIGAYKPCHCAQTISMQAHAQLWTCFPLYTIVCANYTPINWSLTPFFMQRCTKAQEWWTACDPFRRAGQD